MKKNIIVAVACVVTAFLGFSIGKSYGEQKVIMTQKVSGSGHEFYAEYNDSVNHYYNDTNNMSVKAITHIMGEERQDILIKDCDGYILYNGHSSNLHDKMILDSQISKIASCDDTEGVITIILKGGN